jgi:hypothetical protein
VKGVRHGRRLGPLIDTCYLPAVARKRRA